VVDGVFCPLTLELQYQKRMYKVLTFSADTQREGRRGQCITGYPTRLRRGLRASLSVSCVPLNGHLAFEVRFLVPLNGPQHLPPRVRKPPPRICWPKSSVASLQLLQPGSLSSRATYLADIVRNGRLAPGSWISFIVSQLAQVHTRENQREKRYGFRRISVPERPVLPSLGAAFLSDVGPLSPPGAVAFFRSVPRSVPL
jgi:hypothetical protein